MNTQLLQLYPNRITITPQRSPLEFHKVKFNKQCHSFYKEQTAQAIENFKALKNPFIISKASKKKIMDSINTMYVLSQPRNVQMQTGKSIFNYRLSFVTLTLPSQQNHTDTEIKHKCLNQFLIELRKHYNVNNYVWKAELQQNENIHFHLILDNYVDFQALRRRWNRILNKLGYVDAYAQKMSALSLLEYHELRNKNGQQDFNNSVEAYAKGKKANWKNPNSVDVKSVYSKKDLAIYLSKYITKPISKKPADGSNLERQMLFGRSWARSYSLSSIKYKNKFLASEMQGLINYLRNNSDLVLEITGDFFTAFYFSAEKLCKSFQDFHKKFIFANALMYNYIIPK